MTYKIDRIVTEKNHLVLRISGRITGEHVNELRALLEAEKGGLTLDLKNVRLVDGETVKLLAFHESNGMRINNCPPYIREWIRREREAM